MMKLPVSFLFTALAAVPLTFCPPTFAAAPEAAPLSSARPAAFLTKGTPIRVRLETELRSGRSKVDDPVLWTVDQNVYGPNHTLLIGKGAVARGRVTTSAGHGSFGRTGKLSFTCDYALTDDGVRVPLHLSASPVPGAGASSGSTGELAGSVSTGAHGYAPGPYAYPSAAYPGYPYGYPGGDYQQAGTAVSASVDAGRLFGGGADATASRGLEYDATVERDTPVAPAAAVPASAAAQASEQLFTLKDGTQVVGTLMSFDGNGYTLVTRTGQRVLRASEVRSIDAASSGSAKDPK